MGRRAPPRRSPLQSTQIYFVEGTDKRQRVGTSRWRYSRVAIGLRVRAPAALGLEDEGRIRLGLGSVSDDPRGARVSPASTGLWGGSHPPRKDEAGRGACRLAARRAGAERGRDGGSGGASRRGEGNRLHLWEERRVTGGGAEPVGAGLTGRWPSHRPTPGYPSPPSYLPTGPTPSVLRR